MVTRRRTRWAWRGPFSDAEREAATDMATHQRPRTRADCAGGPRPCPFVSCRHHLALDVSEATATTMGEQYRPVFTPLALQDDPAEALRAMTHTCSLDAAEAGPLTLEEVGEALGCTRARAQQLEVIALAKFTRRMAGVDFEDHRELRRGIDDRLDDESYG